MTRGAFKYFVHDHYFHLDNDSTLMRDVIDFASPGGLLGNFVDRMFMANYLRRLIAKRSEAVKHEAERRTSNPTNHSTAKPQHHQTAK